MMAQQIKPGQDQNQSKVKKWLRVGCFPVVALLALLLIGLLNLVTFNDVPYYVSDEMTYRIGGRIVMTMGLLLGLQLMLTWLLSLLAAGAAGRAARPGGQWLRKRLLKVRRSLLLPLMIIVSLRIVIVFLAVTALLLVLTRVFGVQFDSFTVDVVSVLATEYGLLFVALCIMMLVAWLVGPLLRMWNSTAYGTLGGALASDPDTRITSAVTVRLFSGFLLTLGVLWIGALLSLVYLTVVNPSTFSSFREVPMDFYPYSVDNARRWGDVYLSLGLLLALGSFVLQALMPRIILSVTGHLLKRSRPAREKGSFSRLIAAVESESAI